MWEVLVRVYIVFFLGVKVKGVIVFSIIDVFINGFKVYMVCFVGWCVKGFVR